MSKSRIAVEEILRSLSKLNGQAQDILIHRVDVGDFRVSELLSFTLSQAEQELESLKVKIGKIKEMVGEPTKPVPPIHEPAPAPAPAPAPEPILPEIKEVVVNPTAIEPRKPRIRLTVQKEPEVKQEVNHRIVYPSIRRNR
jgi:hypothetical protein